MASGDINISSLIQKKKVMVKNNKELSPGEVSTFPQG